MVREHVFYNSVGSVMRAGRNRDEMI